jgi:hypothetical protein
VIVEAGGERGGGSGGWRSVAVTAGHGEDDALGIADGREGIGRFDIRQRVTGPAIRCFAIGG